MKKKFFLSVYMMTILILTGCQSNKGNLAEEVEIKFNDFMIFNSGDNKYANFEIDLRDTNQIILTSEYAQLINAKEFEGKKTDRQEFLDAWGKLDEEKKSEDKFLQIQLEYKKTIAVLVAAESVLKFYEDVKENATSILDSKEKIEEFYDKSNPELGRRGKAYNDYIKVTAYGEDESTSKRMAYLKERYRDTVNFLESAKFLLDNDIDSAKEEMDKINDQELKNLLESKIN